PNASNLNFVAGQTVPNLVVAKVGDNGQVTIFNAAGTTNVIVDVSGWFDDATPSPFGPAANATGARLVPRTPARLLDTRPNGGPIGAASSRTLTVTGAGGVPSSGVTAVVLNVTATEPTSPSTLTVFPTRSEPPNASNLNFVAGQTVP